MAAGLENTWQLMVMTRHGYWVGQSQLNASQSLAQKLCRGFLYHLFIPLSSPERNVKGYPRVSSQLLNKLVFRMKKIKLIPEPLPYPGPSRLPTAINCQILPILK